MTDRLTHPQLDAMLAIQLTVAWSGERGGDPEQPRLGWWKTDLVDPLGGGDLFKRLAPKTAEWASLILVRAAACRVDETIREKNAHGDRVWTLFHLGFFVDEQLSERLAYHRSHQHKAVEVFGENYLVGQQWTKDLFTAFLKKFGKAKVTIEPTGRRLSARAASAPELVPMFASALLPLTDNYPMPFVDVEVKK